MKFKFIFLTLLFVGLSSNLHAQGDYLANDSTMKAGITLVNSSERNNAQFINQKIGDTRVKYTPEDILEYGFKDGTTYFSRVINVDGIQKKVFLEQLQKGKITLYYYTEKDISLYFIEKEDSSLIELNAHNFRNVIREKTDPDSWIQEQTGAVKFRKPSLEKLFSIYNQTVRKPLPFVRFGVIAGYNSANFQTSSFINNFLEGSEFNPSSSILIGTFMDIPLNMTYFSMNIGINYSKNGFTYSTVSPQSEIDILINTTSLDFPFLIRYTHPSEIWRPFINLGGNLTYHLKNENKIYESLIYQNTITINEKNINSFVSNNMLGYSVGAGLQYNLSLKKILSVELRYSSMFGTNNTLNKNQFNVLMGFSI
jgi:opacity protein-like surface antigen